MASTDPLVPLSGGFVIPASVLTWMLQVSERLSFEITADDRLRVQPQSAIRPGDDYFIRQHRDELLAAVRYCDKQAARPC